jgi:MFS family permease
MPDRKSAEGKSSAHSSLWSWTYVLLISGAFFEALSFTFLFPVLPRLVTQLAGNATDIGLVMGAFNFVSFISRPTAGWLSDRFGRKPLLLVGSIVSSISVAAISIAPSIETLVMLRMLHGAAEAAFYVAAATAVTDIAPEDRRAEAVSIFSIAFFAALGFGPWAGDILLGGGLSSTLTLAAGSAILATLLTAWIAVPSPAPSENLQLAKLFYPAALLPGVLFALSLIGYAGFTGFIVIYLEQSRIPYSGWFFAVYAVTVVGVRIFGARIPELLGPRRAAVSAMVAIAIGLAFLGLNPTLLTALLGTIILGIGQAVCFPALLAVALQRGNESDRGVIVGTLVGFLDVGVALGSLVFGIIGESIGYDVAFLTAGAASVTSAGVLWMTRQTNSSRESSH